MIHAAMWLVSSAIILYATAIITGALFSLSSKDKDKEGARIFGYIIAPFIVIAVLISTLSGGSDACKRPLPARLLNSPPELATKLLAHVPVAVAVSEKTKLKS
jgi:hypothetical protein